ncbi:hypothetical protein [Rubrobacter indicoceani]|uniref:hypothetical protein n=1 Tax=Rubrobacter indicoceani TaxID=2051957 RepID=UPI000E5AC0DE|nr:hypothetical protein [Rubrobacter indicoceani]
MLVSTASSLASAIGRGLAAGAIGTAAMTVSSSIEAKLSDRGASTAPADAAKKVLQVETPNDEAEAHFSNLVHWGYGTAWGAAHGVLGELGLSGKNATLAHLALVWGSEQVVLPSLDVAPPVWESGAKATATDLFHHLVYATATGLAYEMLDKPRN